MQKSENEVNKRLYTDGTEATGPGSLPPLSPKQQAHHCVVLKWYERYLADSEIQSNRSRKIQEAIRWVLSVLPHVAAPDKAAPAPVAQPDALRDAAMYEAGQSDALTCHLPPHGWRCTRTAGHDGPCAAVECPEDMELVARGMDRLRDTPVAPAPVALTAAQQHADELLSVVEDFSSELGPCRMTDAARAVLAKIEATGQEGGAA